jgi:hypothetical protein
MLVLICFHGTGNGIAVLIRINCAVNLGFLSIVLQVSLPFVRTFRLERNI